MSEAIEIQSVTFRPDGMVEIAYIEPRDQSDHVGVIRIIVIETEPVKESVDEAIEDIRHLVDEGLRLLREAA